MDGFFEDNSGILLGSSVLVFVEVVPILSNHSRSPNSNISSAFAKARLQELALGWESEAKEKDANDGETDPTGKQTSCNNRIRRGVLLARELLQSTSQTYSSGHPTIDFPSEDPVVLTSIQCMVIGYSFVVNGGQHASASTNVTMTKGTLVRILPGILATDPSESSPDCPFSLDELCGETVANVLTERMEEDTVYNHNPETIRELHLRMSSQLAEPVCIGTTEDAICLRKRHQTQRKMIRKAVQRRCSQGALSVDATDGYRSKDKLDNPAPRSLLPAIMRDGALLVHCPSHGAGKTTLVKYIARKLLACDSIHVLQPGPLLAKYGSKADAGLESTIHAIAVSAAVKRRSSICIILDHFDSFMPSTLSGRSSKGDAAAPVFNAIASYLKMLVLSLKHRREFPFPSKNLLYNLGGSGGHVLGVKVCMVAIVSCPDNGGRSPQGFGHNTCILDALPIGTYRLPGLTVASRLRAFLWAFEVEEVLLTEDARDRLHSLVASAIWSGGSQHRTVARMLRHLLDKSHTKVATFKNLKGAFGSIGRNTSGFSNLSIQEADDESRPSHSLSGEEDPFSFIGGSSDAKQSLKDALTLDDSKRGLLQSMGIDPPIGVLFYGPPGCGKTLLAKGVARLLGATGAANLRRGGAFISLNSSEIVQSEIGSSEKIIVSAFRSARENAPSVLFIDEFQALFVERRNSGSGKLSSTLLQCMDDIKQWRSANKKGHASSSDFSSSVVVLGATNTPWMIDKAFLRPGRFDRIVHVGLPSQNERESILNVHTSKMRITGGLSAKSLLSSILAEKTNGFSGAELAALCRAATVRCLLENSERVVERHFLQELEVIVVNGNAELVKRNKIWKPRDTL